MTEASRRTVLVTGATGYIASQMLPAFRERYDVRLIDVRDTDHAGSPVTGAQVVDLLNDAFGAWSPSVELAPVIAYPPPPAGTPIPLPGPRCGN